MKFLSSAQYGAKIVDVRQCRTGEYQIAERGEKPGRVVVCEDCDGIKTRRLGARKSPAVSDRARRVRTCPCSAVDAVGIGGGDLDIVGAIGCDGGTKDELLVRATTALSAYGHGGFAA